MIISGTTPIKTYFVLNKKDRSGNIQSRPFQQVLEEMKRQEIEEIKAKQLILNNELTLTKPSHHLHQNQMVLLQDYLKIILNPYLLKYLYQLK